MASNQSSESLNIKLASLSHYQADETLRCGQVLKIRSISPDDGGRFRQIVEALSEDSLYMRFLAPRQLSDRDIEYFTALDFVEHVGLIAEIDSGLTPLPVGVGEFIRDKEDATSAEVALAVRENFQGKGIGTALLKHLTKIALGCGIKELHGLVLADNQKLKRLLRRWPSKVIYGPEEDGVVMVSVHSSGQHS